MKIKRKDLNRIIESFLKEENTDPGDGSSEKEDSEKTDIGDTFYDAQSMRYGGGAPPRNKDADIQAVTDARKGSDRGGFPPLTFGPGIDNEGNLMPGDFTTIRDYREPDDDDIAAVRRREKNPYNLGKDEKSVYDLEHTIYSPEEEDEDEDTEESPFGTQYSLENTFEVPDYNQDDDVGLDLERDDSQDVITYEDEEGNERTFVGGKEVTPGSYRNDQNFIGKLRSFFSRKR